MPNKEEVKEHILSIWKISIMAKKCYNYSFYLYSPGTTEELNYLNRSRDFKFIRHILWRNSIIELSKLFSNSKKRDKYNIFNFINKLKKDQYYGGFNINQDKIDNWENQLKENENLIKSIILLRDKVYAHTDSESQRNSLDTPTFIEMGKLIEIVDNLIQEIYSSIFDTHASVDNPFVDETPSAIVKILVEEKQNRLNSLNDLLNKNKPR